MATCLRLNAVLKVVSHGCGCQHLRLVSLRPLSFLAAQQHGHSKPLMPRPQLTCPVRIPHTRQEVTFTKKRRKFTPHHKEDGVSKDMGVVYENNMNRFNFWGQLTINLLALPIYGMSVNILVSNWPITDLSITSGPLSAIMYILTFGSLHFGVNNICMCSIQRIYTDAEASHFAAVVQDWRMMKHTIHFDLASAERKPPGQVLGSFFGNLKIRGKSYLVTPTDFVQPRFYNLLMGYEMQRPADQDMIQDIDIKDYMHKKGRNLKRPK
ncbi:hypothetical protein ACOMHN_027301 [Nucella lapillus]